MPPAPLIDRTPVAFDAALAAQRALVELRRHGRIPDLLWLLEHPPTITLGARGGLDHILEPFETLERRGVCVRKADRGGDVTCHEPGQLVGYPIVSLDAPEERDLRRYLRSIEEGLIRYLRSLGIEGRRIPGRTGVWIDGRPPRKIAAIGVGARRWIAFHGFALNVENSLRGFEAIVPCGIAEAEVTSVARELSGTAPPWDAVAGGVHRALEEALARPLERIAGREGLERAGLIGPGGSAEDRQASLRGGPGSRGGA